MPTRGFGRTKWPIVIEGIGGQLAKEGLGIAIVATEANHHRRVAPWF
jgi:hypothetical protein